VPLGFKNSVLPMKLSPEQRVSPGLGKLADAASVADAQDGNIRPAELLAKTPAPFLSVHALT
jgi:hypothetical protein